MHKNGFLMLLLKLCRVTTGYKNGNSFFFPIWLLKKKKKGKTENDDTVLFCLIQYYQS